MQRRAVHARVLAVLLMVAAVRTLDLRLAASERLLLDPVHGPPTVLPDLARDGWLRLSWLPGIGPEKARRIVAQRPHLGVPLRASRLALLSGVGSETAAEVEECLAAWTKGMWPGPRACGGRR